MQPTRKDVRGLALLLVVGGLILGGVGFGSAPKGWLSGAARVGFNDLAQVRLIGRSVKADHLRRYKLRELDLRFKQGVAMLHAGQHEFAVTAFSRVLAIDPNVPEAHVNMGFALLGLKEYKDALAAFDRAIAIRDRELSAYYGMALALEGLASYGGAAAALQTFLHLAPHDDPFYERAKAKFAEVQQRFMEQRSAATPPADQTTSQERQIGNPK